MVIQMIKDTDKRTDKRHNCDAKIKWTQFNQIGFNYGQESYYHARALNFSKNGLHLKTEHPLKPGMIILFRLEASHCGASDLEDCECIRTISLAEVKWCKHIVKNGESYFGIGVDYPIPY